MAGWKPYTVDEIASEVHQRTFVLPVVQRRLVWSADKMELLFDTLLKGNAFGGIIVLEEALDTKPLFESRPFSQDGQTHMSSERDEILRQKKFFVIDGQQRLQTFFMGLFGSFEGKTLYFDLYGNHQSSYEFRFDIKSLLRGQVDGDLAEQGRSIRERRWQSVPELYRLLRNQGGDANDVIRNLLASPEREDSIHEDALRANVSAFCKHIFQENRVGVDAVTINRNRPELENRQRIVELFRRLNDGGTVLSSFDLFASILKGLNWHMESFLEEMLKENQGMGLNQDNLIKLVFLLQGESRKEMSEITPSDANFAIDNKERIKRSLELTREFLKKAKLDEYYASGNRSFIPVFFIICHLYLKDARSGYWSNFDTNHAEFKPMKDWLYHSLLNNTFKSRGVGWNPYRTGIALILRIIMESNGASFPKDAIFELYRNRLHEFETEYLPQPKALDRLDRDFLFYLTYQGNSTTTGRDVDHVHPRSRLMEAGIEWDRINSVANFQLIDVSTNRGTKNDKPFDEWLNGATDQGKNVTDIPGFLERHLIPTDPATHQISNFDRFLDQRSNLIAKKLQSIFNG